MTFLKGAVRAVLLLGAALAVGWIGKIPAARGDVSEFSLYCPAKFITCMAASPRGHTIAVGTDDRGLFIYGSAGGGRWREFSRSNNPAFPANNVCSLCFDPRGRLWVGTLRSGVIVGIHRGHHWHWRNYVAVTKSAEMGGANGPGTAAPACNGPLGAHVLAIAKNPLDKSIWVATEAGLSIYTPYRNGHRYTPRDKRHHRPRWSRAGTFGQWHYITPANGLPPSEPDCIAFGRNGRAFVGTQCGGLCMADPRRGYRHWRVLVGPRQPTDHAFGNGLPSSLVNCILATRAGVIYVGTDWGLALSRDNGNSWRYERGRDFAAKVLGRSYPLRGWDPPARPVLAKLLPGDHITCLAEDSDGRIWMGFWRNGFFGVNPKTGQSFRSSQEHSDAFSHRYVSSLLAVPGGGMLVGHYGHGVSELSGIGGPGQPTDTSGRKIASEPAIRFPAAAIAPDRRRLLAMLAVLLGLRVGQAHAGQIAVLPDDWRTQGDWLGRYGTYYADLAAWISHGDFNWGTGRARKNPELLNFCPQIGGHHRKGDVIRRWVQWNSTANPDVLEMPAPFLDNRVYFGMGHWFEPRREAEWDDHGETYPFTWQGPSVYVGLRVPKGEFFLSIYEFNKDGHSGANRLRDYSVSVRREPYHFPIARLHSLHNSAPVHNRVVNFWNGVWENFIVRGPAQYQLGVGRNFSFNTILQTVMLDRTTTEPFPYFSPKNRYNRVAARPVERRVRVARAVIMRRMASALAPAIATAVVRRLRTILRRDPALWARFDELDYTLLARELSVQCTVKANLDNTHVEHALQADLGRCYYHIGLFHRWEACQTACGYFPARLVEKNLRWQGGPRFTSLEDRYLVQAYLTGACGKPPGVQPHADYFRDSVVDEFDHPGAW